MHITKERLQEKGWSQEEINHALETFSQAKENRHPKIGLLDTAVYWFGLLLMIIGTLAFSLMILPLLLTVNSIALYFIIIIFALTFGMMMSIAVRDIEIIERFHHVIVFSVVPIIGVINFFIVVNIANTSFIADALQVHHNPLILAMVYLASFVTPYFFMVFKRKWTKSI